MKPREFGRDQVFKLVEAGDHSELVFSAESQEEYQKWIEGIREVKQMQQEKESKGVVLLNS